METLSRIIELLALGGLIYGYIKKNRNIMLASAIVLWIGSALPDLKKGFSEGFQAGRSAVPVRPGAGD